MYQPQSHLCRTVALSLLVASQTSAFGCHLLSAFAAPTGATSSTFRSRPRYSSTSAAAEFAGVRKNNMSRGADGDAHAAAAPAPPGGGPLSRPIRRVTVVGGTHGNEYTGVWCIKALERQRALYHARGETAADRRGGGADGRGNVFEAFPSLAIDTLLGNPRAFQQNKRFVDVDLNREFSMDKLVHVPLDEKAREGCDVRNEFCSALPSSDLPHEAVRAREVEALLGPKFAAPSAADASCADPAAEVVIDLHTTTANMGVSLIIPEGDPAMAAAAAYVLRRCQDRYGADGAQCLMHALPERRHRMNLASCGRHGFTIEVGPTPQGVLRHDAVEKTETALRALLEFLHRRNRELEDADDDDGADDGADDDAPPPVLEGLRAAHPGGTVPCYRSAPAARPGELSGKISWPSDPANPNFPALMVHKDVQDRDFRPIRTGDPLFVRPDGGVVPYDGSHGDEVYLVFVNEGGYYYQSSGTGIGVAVRSRFDWRTGRFAEEGDGGTDALDEEDNGSHQ